MNPRSRATWGDRFPGLPHNPDRVLAETRCSERGDVLPGGGELDVRGHRQWCQSEFLLGGGIALAIDIPAERRATPAKRPRDGPHRRSVTTGDEPQFRT